MHVLITLYSSILVTFILLENHSIVRLFNTKGHCSGGTFPSSSGGMRVAAKTHAIFDVTGMCLVLSCLYPVEYVWF